MQLGSDILPIQNRLVERDLPKLPTVMHQRWEELLFLHWTFEPQIIAKVLPSNLRVDTLRQEISLLTPTIQNDLSMDYHNVLTFMQNAAAKLLQKFLDPITVAK